MSLRWKLFSSNEYTSQDEEYDEKKTQLDILFQTFTIWCLSIPVFSSLVKIYFW